MDPGKQNKIIIKKFYLMNLWNKDFFSIESLMSLVQKKIIQYLNKCIQFLIVFVDVITVAFKIFLYRAEHLKAGQNELIIIAK